MLEIVTSAQAPVETVEVVESSEEVAAPARKRGGGFFRFLFIGLVIGAVVALFGRRGGNDDDEDFGEENWIEVKHEDTGSGAAVPTAAPVEAHPSSNDAADAAGESAQ